jgi:hypothetical protein
MCGIGRSAWFQPNFDDSRYNVTNPLFLDFVISSNRCALTPSSEAAFFLCARTTVAILLK